MRAVIVSDGPQGYRSTEPFVWEIGPDDTVTVPAGTPFDVSVPRWLQPIFRRDDKRFLRAALIHDWMLRRGYSRLTAAGVFADVLRADHVDWVSRLMMYLAVALYRWR